MGISAKLSISIEIRRDVEIDAIIRLYEEAGWWRDAYDRKFISGILTGSFCFAAAYAGDELIGMGRALSDGASDAYIQDVTVLKALRGRGVGRRIILAIINHLKAHGVDWIALVGEPGTRGFYEKLGFREMHAYIPMKLSD
ncbi:MAG: hypothetical protein A2020_06560 [Lentisphaerae bacterium GWF2_45_14]|nr:MAG: hypothetical protein A2020_06560 [Lentisphaerae bacterium GWF2_45_14]